MRKEAILTQRSEWKEAVEGVCLGFMVLFLLFYACFYAILPHDNFWTYASLFICVAMFGILESNNGRIRRMCMILIFAVILIGAAASNTAYRSTAKTGETRQATRSHAISISEEVKKLPKEPPEKPRGSLPEKLPELP